MLHFLLMISCALHSYLSQTNSILLSSLARASGRVLLALCSIILFLSYSSQDASELLFCSQSHLPSILHQNTDVVRFLQGTGPGICFQDQEPQVKTTHEAGMAR